MPSGTVSYGGNTYEVSVPASFTIKAGQTDMAEFQISVKKKSGSATISSPISFSCSVKFGNLYYAFLLSSSSYETFKSTAPTFNSYGALGWSDAISPSVSVNSNNASSGASTGVFMLGTEIAKRFTTMKTVPVTIDVYVPSSMSKVLTLSLTGNMDSSFAPTFTSVASVTTTNPFDSNSFYANLSTLSLGFQNVALKANATLKTRLVSFNGVSSTTSLNTSPISEAGSYIAKWEVTDSRGFSTVSTKTYNFQAYNPPTIINASAERVDDDGLPAEDGQKAKVHAIFSFDNLSVSNSASYKILYKLRTADSFTTLSSLTLLETPKEIQTTTADVFDPEKSYILRLQVNDKAKTVTKDFDLDTSFFTMDFLQGGKGIAFGTPSTKEGFENDMETWFNRDTHLLGSVDVDGATTFDGETTFRAKATYNKAVAFNDALDAYKTIVVHANNGLIAKRADFNANDASSDAAMIVTPAAAKDKNDFTLGGFNCRLNTDGNVATLLYSQKSVSGATKTNTFWLWTRADGSYHYSVASPVNFKQDLGIQGVNNSESYPILTNKDGGTTGYICTPEGGILPRAAFMAKNCYVGTTQWPFTAMRAKTFHAMDSDAGIGAYMNVDTYGTASQLGTASVRVGNPTAQGSANNYRGRLQVYNVNSSAGNVYHTSGADNCDIYLPMHTGFIVGYTTLYNSSTGTTGTVTLSESAANFKFIEIIYQKTADATYMGRASTRVFNNGGTATAQLTVSQYNTATSGLGILQTVTKKATISGTSITVAHTGRGNFRTDGTITCGSENNIYILQVIGWK